MVAKVDAKLNRQSHAPPVDLPEEETKVPQNPAPKQQPVSYYN
jgi:hypothetical protein